MQIVQARARQCLSASCNSKSSSLFGRETPDLCVGPQCSSHTQTSWLSPRDTYKLGERVSNDSETLRSSSKNWYNRRLCKRGGKVLQSHSMARPLHPEPDSMSR